MTIKDDMIQKYRNLRAEYNNIIYGAKENNFKIVQHSLIEASKVCTMILDDLDKIDVREKIEYE